MANNVTLHQKNKDGAYDNIYPRTTADHTMLTSATGNKYGLTDGNAEQAVSISMDFISTIGAISMYVFDPLGNPVEGAVVQGLSGNPSTNASGFVQGTVVDNPVTVKSPYVDLKDKSVNVTSYVGTTTAMRVTLESLGENGIVRFTRSTNVKFSHVTKTVDVCCVGGGGGGCKNYSSYNGTASLSYYPGGGGGGGAIVNEFNLVPQPEILYNLNVGTGGSSGYPATDGGTSNFMDVYAPGGKGAANVQGGAGGNTESGNGGTGGQDAHVGNGGRATVSEFTDGKVYYSGGGGGGHRYLNETSGIVPFTGGSPNGANGGAASKGSHRVDATKAGIGGGGGGGTTDNYGFSYNEAQPSAGGPGLVAIRIHLS